MAQTNRRFLLRERPAERCVPETFELVEEEVPDIGEGEALVRTEWISLDPTNRAWIGETPTYLPPVGIGEVMRAPGWAAWSSRSTRATRRAQLVQGLIGWQECDGGLRLGAAAAGDRGGGRGPEPLSRRARHDRAHGLDRASTRSASRRRGRRSWSRRRPGAVGSVAGQLAKARGARVVGIAGGPEKMRAAHGAARLRRRGGLQGRRLARPARRPPRPTASTWTSRTWAARSWTRSSRA